MRADTRLIGLQFLEDFFDITIDSIELLQRKHRLTDRSVPVEFDFRCHTIYRAPSLD
ncbi:MAG: hypothetical protein HGA42_12725 [Nostocales cyanobacterium W4_Combined_metabat2_030]|nr:hypothetical protein [Nostocales cyanobacterium W4_Combined_metabat2_030]